MEFQLTVIEPFLDFKKGDLIKNTKEVEKVVNSEWQGHVIKTQVPAAPAAKK